MPFNDVVPLDDEGRVPVVGTFGFSGSVAVVGQSASGSLATGFPITVAGIDLNGSTRIPLLAYNGVAFHQEYERPTFTAYASSISNANNKNMLAIVNSDESPWVIRITGIKILNVQTTAVTGIVARFELKRISGLSGATPVAIQPHDLIDPVPIQITAGSGGVAFGESVDVLNKWLWSTDEWGPGTLDTESNQITLQNRFVWEASPGRKPYTLRPDSGMMIVFRGSTSSGFHDVMIEFTVSPA